jgi:hypothetical protein
VRPARSSAIQVRAAASESKWENKKDALGEAACPAGPP